MNINNKNKNKNKNKNNNNNNNIKNIKATTFILDASCFEKALGHVLEWIELTSNKQKNSICFYLPTFTIEELNFLKNKRKNMNAIKSLKIIDTKSDFFDLELCDEGLKDNTSSGNGSWNSILEKYLIIEKEKNSTYIKKLPSRFKKLIKAYYNFQEKTINLEPKSNPTSDDNDSNKSNNGSKPTTPRCYLVTCDENVEKLCGYFTGINLIDVLKADSLIVRNKKLDFFKKKFISNMEKSVIPSDNDQTTSQEDFDDVKKTDFKKTVWAQRGKGELWVP
ncbi:Nmd4p SCDLUD_005259 [Saccharomycodes ludwigii]|uniref:Nmd4p n=1 Tax=Saccharomycodes ludwigii TaxID=36035 RepID=UPI001E87AD52|nr:hypothetical protein SCDLUD_005259 [Saccharomycodes ludwigii]KAH3898915.1 hypothetical protein SCDLUD_005259 [Saccharomycodes ludwigii]